jgi:hypothetical protein
MQDEAFTFVLYVPGGHEIQFADPMDEYVVGGQERHSEAVSEL